MRLVEVKPHKRDKTAAAFYKVMDYYFRLNRKVIEKQIFEGIRDFICNGDIRQERDWKV